jgi:ERCC4-related helicase
MNRKRDFSELSVKPREQDEFLQGFRSGSINLMVATSVLEEGVDIPNCHIVICFDAPKTLKAFIQRRGRARRQESKYLIMTLETPGDSCSHDIWQKLEASVSEAIADDLRAAEDAEALEALEEKDDLVFRIPSTG